MNTDKIRELNDNLRKNMFKTGKDKLVLTHGVLSLPEEIQWRILAKVRLFNDFNEGNDPYGEHDFGMVEYYDTQCFFKIDYYDKSMKYASDDPSNPDITIRVLTIMLASEY